jgi:hypothetical protein
MIHKFWNVRLASSQDAADTNRQLNDATDEEERNAVRDEEERMEEKVYRIWSVLSTFEESSAACISDMLLHVSNGAYVDGVLVAKKFIFHVDILFHSADKLDATMTKIATKGMLSLPLLKGVHTDRQQGFHTPEKRSYYARRLWPFLPSSQRPKRPELESLV